MSHSTRPKGFTGHRTISLRSASRKLSQKSVYKVFPDLFLSEFFQPGFSDAGLCGIWLLNGARSLVRIRFGGRGDVFLSLTLFLSDFAKRGRWQRPGLCWAPTLLRRRTLITQAELAPHAVGPTFPSPGVLPHLCRLTAELTLRV